MYQLRYARLGYRRTGLSSRSGPQGLASSVGVPDRARRRREVTASLAEQAEDFANDLTKTIRAVVGEECPAFRSVALEKASAFWVRQQPQDGITLRDKEGPTLRLAVDDKCTLDGHNKWMAISESQIHVFVEPDGREPLFRCEFDRNNTGKIPSAHIQFHGDHPELEKAMRDCGDSTDRAKARKRGRREVRLHDLHFPVGGPRFRRALEDVLEMLIEEFGVKPAGSVTAARRALGDAREDWRREQVATVVRDAPSTAADALRDLDDEVIDPKPPKKDKHNKLRAL